MRRRLSELLKLPLADFRQRDLAADREWSGVLRWLADGGERGAIEMSKNREGLRLSYAYASSGQPVTQYIGLRYLPRHFGGFLVVAVCPGCWRRVRVLYFRRAFYCNRCTRAVYASSSLDKASGAQTQYQKLRERVRPGTWDAGIGYFPRRPKRMRRVTYNRLRNRAYAQLYRYHAFLDRGLYRLLARIAPADFAALVGDDK